MITANNRAHSSPPAPHVAAQCVVLLALASCGDPAPVPCPDLARDLRTLDLTAYVHPRELLEQVDAAIESARPRCANLVGAVRASGIPQQLARARLVDDRPDLALAELSAIGHAAVALRRAELLDRMGRPRDALAALSPALALDAQAYAQSHLLAISIAATGRDLGALDRLLATAPITERHRLAHRAIADAPPDFVAQLAASTAAELTSAAGDKLEQSAGPAAARAARERSALLEPDVAEHWDALGRARIASGATDDALAAWDRAIAIAPAQPTFRIAPIKALVIAGDTARAKHRAATMASQARAGTDIDLLVTASSGAVAAKDPTLALELARDAFTRRSTDGRLAFLVAQRHAEVGDTEAAARRYANLLVCGVHGRPWHRHEVAARLLGLNDRARVAAALDAERTCEPVEPADLADYVTRLRADGSDQPSR